MSYNFFGGEPQFANCTLIDDVHTAAAGASWSSLDYGGAWKPLHYGLGRWFDDLALSVQHDLNDDVIKVSVRYVAMYTLLHDLFVVTLA